MKTPRTRKNIETKLWKNGNKRRKRKREEESEDSEFKLGEEKKTKREEDFNGNKRRKSKAQVKMLEIELANNPHWTNEDMVEIAKKTKLSKGQVYKWNWDQRKKLNILPSKVYVVQLPEGSYDTQSGQLILKSANGLQKLQTLNLKTVIQKPEVKPKTL